MEYIIIAIVIITILIITKFIFSINFKEMKQMGENKRLDELTKKYPDNIRNM